MHFVFSKCAHPSTVVSCTASILFRTLKSFETPLYKAISYNFWYNFSKPQYSNGQAINLHFILSKWGVSYCHLSYVLWSRMNSTYIDQTDSLRSVGKGIMTIDLNRKINNLRWSYHLCGLMTWKWN